MTISNHFQFSAAWPKNSDDVAEIFLCVGDSVISRIADTKKGTVRDYFRASSTSLALWLADNWWRLRWETISEKIGTTHDLAEVCGDLEPLPAANST